MRAGSTGRFSAGQAIGRAYMRVLCGVLCTVLLLFAAVQYNDPDALFWGTVYAAGAAWCGLAAFRPGLLRTGPARGLLVLSLGLTVWGLVAFFPEEERWWAMEVWWPEASGETSREGMGMMVLAAAVAAAALVGLRRA
jgi:hypothetical protein